MCSISKTSTELISCVFYPSISLLFLFFSRPITAPSSCPKSFRYDTGKSIGKRKLLNSKNTERSGWRAIKSKPKRMCGCVPEFLFDFRSCFILTQIRDHFFIFMTKFFPFLRKKSCSLFFLLLIRCWNLMEMPPINFTFFKHFPPNFSDSEHVITT